MFLNVKKNINPESQLNWENCFSHMEKQLGAEKMSQIKLSNDEKLYFAEAAHSLRFDDSPIGQIVTPDKFLKVRRSEEANASDLFSVFNVVQENVIKGGLTGYARERGQFKRVRSREVKGIDQNIKLNKALWTLAEKMLQLKQ